MYLRLLKGFQRVHWMYSKVADGCGNAAREQRHYYGAINIVFPRSISRNSIRDVGWELNFRRRLRRNPGQPK